MKRIYALLLVLLILFPALALIFPWGMPSEDLDEGAVLLSSGQAAQMENREVSSRIYIWNNEKLDSLYTEPRLSDGRERQIVELCETEKGLAFLQIYTGGTDWELLELKDKKAEKLYTGTFEDTFAITGLRPDNEKYWVTGIGDNGAIYIYQCGVEGAALKCIIPAWWYKDTVSAEYDGKEISITDAFGEEYLAKLDVRHARPANEADVDVPELPRSGSALLQYKKLPLLGMLCAWLLVAATILITAVICRRAGRLAVRMTAVGGELLLLGLLALGVASCLIVRSTSGLEAMAETAMTGLPIFLALWIIGVAALYLASHGVIRPLQSLTRQMTEVSEGKANPRAAAEGRDEVSNMDRSMQEMLMDLSIRDYELEATIRSYQRFVPEKMTELLDRASVAEVSLGDNICMDSNVGFFTIGNRGDARKLLSDESFIAFVNHCFKTLHSCIRENNGCLLSNAMRLSAVEIMFPKDAADGVRAGLDLLGNTVKRPREDIPAPRPFLMLHHASFIYGVSGEENRLFPYFSSSELEFLGGFAENFHETDTRIVMTDAYLNEMKDCQVNTRYIGFVSDGEAKSYKLYEVLDGYPELERDLRLSYDKRFQEGINLFYRNDFFLARNLFSNLLRACPGDGIARWYLFACEHYFNQQGGEEPDYRLFGVQEN